MTRMATSVSCTPRCFARYDWWSKPGLHSKRWTRQQAVRYFTDTLGDPETFAITEVERYCVWPGQACAYLLGKLTLLAQRARAQETFAEKFDIRKFHDAMLPPAALPLDLLERIYA
jgi:uncharacterized protein (DUF885 family)